MSDRFEPSTPVERHSEGGATTILFPPARDQVSQSSNPQVADGGDPAPWLPPPPAAAAGQGEGGWGPWGAAAAGGGVGGWGPWGEALPWAPPPSRPSRPPLLRRLALLGVSMALVLSGLGVGFALGSTGKTPAVTASSAGSHSGSGSATPSGWGPPRAGSGSGSAGGIADASQVAAKVDPGLVDVYTTLGYQSGAAAGTGMVLTSTGEVLTNNHVVEGSTSISVTDVGNGRTYSASVVGTDKSNDVAVLQLSGASGLATVDIGHSSSARVGQPVVAIGNAGGVGGTPSVSSGAIRALDQSITAGDQSSGVSEQLSGLMETSATLQPGDSGGPLVSFSGQVLGVDTAASSGFQFQSGSDQNFAIPVDRAISIAKQIEAGDASSTIHIGPTAFLGVQVQPASASLGSSGVTGAAVVGAEPGSPAASAGVSAGDVIDSLGGQSVDSPTTLSNLMEARHPGDRVQLGWTDSSGQQHTADVQLATGPAA